MLHSVRPIEILLVEDDPSDVELIQEAFAGSKIRNRIHSVGDGVEAINFLKHRGAYVAAVIPDLILLDLHMPRMDGEEVLEIVKRDPELKTIPIVIFTSSEAENDIARSYKLQANCYINKPDDLENLREVVKAVEDFWLSVVKLPKKDRSREQAA